MLIKYEEDFQTRESFQNSRVYEKIQRNFSNLSIYFLYSLQMSISSFSEVPQEIHNIGLNLPKYLDDYHDPDDPSQEPNRVQKSIIFL